MQIKRIILASQSPRRQQLLKEAGFDFEIFPTDVEEIFPNTTKIKDVALYLSNLKSNAAFNLINDDNALIIAADTVVIVDNKILGKPTNIEHAKEMLRTISDRKHLVITGVSIKTKEAEINFDSSTEVFIRPLEETEISFYAEKFKPLDKAGAYGIQEWIGYIAIERVEGSFYNVMGLPIAKLYAELKKLGVFPRELIQQ